MAILPMRRRGVVALLILIGCGLVANVAEGVRLGQSKTLFYPMGRLRETMTVALSMMREPPPLGYQGYDAIELLLKGAGLYISPAEGDRERREAVFRDSVSIDAVLADALSVPIDFSQQNQIIHANDVGYADFMRFAFVLFGTKLSSLYYFYSFILFIGVAAFVIEFLNSRFMLFAVSIYLSVHIFLLQYCISFGPSVGSIANSRTFTGLALLPALHLVCQQFTEVPPGLRSVGTAIVQAFLLTFLLLCRFDVIWEAGFVFAVTLTFCLIYVLGAALRRPAVTLRRFASLFPALILLLSITGFWARETWALGPNYQRGPVHHPVWDSVLDEVLNTDDGLYSLYTGRNRSDSGPDSESTACFAVNHYLEQNAAGLDLSHREYDCSNPVRVYFSDSGNYNADTRRVVLEIFREHPLLVLTYVRLGIRQLSVGVWQAGNFSFDRFEFPGLLALLSFGVYAVSGGLVVSRRDVLRAVTLSVILAIFAIIDPAATGSLLVPGSIASFMLLAMLAVSTITLVLATLFARYISGRSATTPVNG